MSTITYASFLEFKNIKEALLWISRNRWGKTPRCPECHTNNVKIVSPEKTDRLKYQCKSYGCDLKYFTPLYGTPVFKTQISIDKWAFASNEYNKGEKGLSCVLLAKMLNIQVPSAFRMYKQLEKVNQMGLNLFGKYNPKTPYRRHKMSKRNMSFPAWGQNSFPVDYHKEVLHLEKPGFVGDAKKMGRKRKKGGNREKTISWFEFFQQFPTDKEAMDELIRLKWGKNIQCPKCFSNRTSVRRGKRYGTFRCLNKACSRYDFNVFTLDAFHKNKLGAQKVLFIKMIFMTDRTGVSALGLKQKIGCVYHTGFWAAHRVRNMMWYEPKQDVKGPVEIDDAYPRGYGFSLKNRAKNAPDIRVSGVYSINDGRRFMTISSTPANTASTNDFLKKVLASDSVNHIMSDASMVNFGLKKYGYKVETVNHGTPQFARRSSHKTKFKDPKMNKKIVTTNHLEAWWRETKNMSKGAHRGVTVKYLPLYMGEAAFRMAGGRVELDMSHRLQNLIKNGIGRYVPKNAKSFPISP